MVNVTCSSGMMRSAVSGSQMFLQHGPGAEPDLHQDSIEIAGLVSERRRHQDDGPGREREAVGADPHAGGEGVAGVHHPLRLSGGSRGVAELDHLVRIHPALVEQRPVSISLPAAHERGFEPVLGLRPRARDVLEIGRFARMPAIIGSYSEPAEHAGMNRARVCANESMNSSSRARKIGIKGFEIAPISHAREVQRRELHQLGSWTPPRLPSHAVGGEPGSDAPRDPVHVAVGEVLRAPVSLR